MLQAKKGQMIIITSGEYSDKQNIGLFKSLADFNVRNELKLYRSRTGDPEKFGVGAYGFVMWMIQNRGLICEVDSTELDLGYFEPYADKWIYSSEPT